MANLSDLKNRQVSQEEQIGRRASIVPEDRNTRAPQLEVNASMGTARRGNGGADQLLKALGMVEKTGNQFVDYLQADHAQREQTAMEQGALDQLTDAVDPEKERKSLGYRNAVTKGRTMTAFAEAQRGFDQDLRGLIEQQDSPDLATRQAEVADRLERFYHDFALDPETGELKEFMRSPGAMRYLADEIGRTRAAFKANAMQRIEERFNVEAIGHFSQSVVDQATMTGTVDLQLVMSALPDTVPAEARNAAFVTAIGNAAEALKSEGRYEEAVRLLDGTLGRKPVSMTTGVPEVPVGAPSAPAATSAPPAPVSGLFNNPVGGGKVTSRYGASRGARTHNGVDIAVPVGTPVRAAMGGEVIRVWTADDGGLSVKIKYDDGTVAGFAHLSAADVEQGQRIAAGAVLAKSGNSGRSTGPHLHYTLTRDGKKIDPLSAKPEARATSGPATAPDDPVKAAPGFRLMAPDPDPVTAYEQSGALASLAGAETLDLSGTAVAQLRAQRDRLASDIRTEWERKRGDEQGNNASSMLLRLYGQGPALSSAEITDAIRNQAITAQQGVTLFGVLRQNANAAEAYQDRMDARADREEAKAQKEQAESIAGRYISGILTGRMSGAQARSRLLAELPRIGDPIVQASVANTVLGTSSDIEQLITNSEPVRSTVTEFEDQRDLWSQAFSGAGLRGSKLTTAQNAAGSLLDRAQAEFVGLVRNNVDPQEAKRRVAAKYQPKLQSLLPQKRAPAK